MVKEEKSRRKEQSTKHCKINIQTRQKETRRQMPRLRREKERKPNSPYGGPLVLAAGTLGRSNGRPHNAECTPLIALSSFFFRLLAREVGQEVSGSNCVCVEQSRTS